MCSTEKSLNWKTVVSISSGYRWFLGADMVHEQGQKSFQEKAVYKYTLCFN